MLTMVPLSWKLRRPPDHLGLPTTSTQQATSTPQVELVDTTQRADWVGW